MNSGPKRLTCLKSIHTGPQQAGTRGMLLQASKSPLFRPCEIRPHRSSKPWRAIYRNGRIPGFDHLSFLRPLPFVALAFPRWKSQTPHRSNPAESHRNVDTTHASRLLVYILSVTLCKLCRLRLMKYIRPVVWKIGARSGTRTARS